MQRDDVVFDDDDEILMMLLMSMTLRGISAFDRPSLPLMPGKPGHRCVTAAIQSVGKQ